MSFKGFATSTILVTMVMMGVGVESIQATVVPLSQYSSDGSVYTQAQYLSADLEFVVDDILDTLTLIVTNNTFDDYPATDQTAFDIREVYFNVNEATVTDLTLSDVWQLDEFGVKIDGNKKNDWDNNTDVTFNSKANGFGLFDVLVQGDDASVVIEPTGTGGVYAVKFVFDISGTGSYSDVDFTTHLSAPFDNNQLGVVAAKFVSGGPNGIDSAYGMTVPEPTTICLLGLGGLLLLRKRRT